MRHRLFSRGFTIVELLVVIVVIGVLASIVVVAYSSAQDNARFSKAKADIAQIAKAMQIARNNTSKTLPQVTGSGWTMGSCYNKPAGTDLAALPRTDTCWTVYLTSLQNISNASGININNMTDPWGRPYAFDENEGEGGDCSPAKVDWISVHSMPFLGPIWGPWKDYMLYLPKSGYSGCTT